MSFRLPALAGVLLLVACGEWKAVPVGADEYISALNVIAILSPDDTTAVSVLVGRTVPPDSPIYSSNTDDSYQDLVSLLRVEDAEVTISADGEQVVLAYTDEGRPERNFAEYLPVDGAFDLVAGRTYQITVRTPDGLEVTGETTVPVAIELSIDPSSSNLEPGDPVTVRWGSTTGHYHVRFAMIQAPGREFRINRKQVVLEDDTSWTFIVPSPEAFAYQDTLVVPDSYILEVALMTVDDNYRDFFFEGPGSGGEFGSSLIMGGNLITNASYGLTGGIGVICSYRRATLPLTIRL